MALGAIGGFTAAATLGALGQATLQASAGYATVAQANVFVSLGLHQTGTWSAGRTLGISPVLSFSTSPAVYFEIDAYIIPVSIISGEVFGSATFSMLMFPLGVVSAQAFGQPTQEFNLTAALVAPTGIPSSESFGTPTQSFTLSDFVHTVTFVGIPTKETFGAPVVVYTPVTMKPMGIPSGESFGTPSQARILTA
jgi:hypothetical protein